MLLTVIEGRVTDEWTHVHYKTNRKAYTYKLFSYPSSPPSDCRRLRFSLLADIVRLINSHIIIISIIIQQQVTMEMDKIRPKRLFWPAIEAVEEAVKSNKLYDIGQNRTGLRFRELQTIVKYKQYVQNKQTDSRFETIMHTEVWTSQYINELILTVNDSENEKTMSLSLTYKV